MVERFVLHSVQCALYLPMVSTLFLHFLIEDGKFWVNLVKNANVKVE